MSANVLLHAEGLGKTFKRGDTTEHVLRGVTFDILSGEFVAIVGPSGSGKSTLLHLLGFMDRPTSGHIDFEGRRLSDASEPALDQFRREKLGFIFQTFNLMSMLTAEENVEISLLGYELSALQRRERVSEALKAVGMYEHRGKRPRELSGGQRQRVAIARAFVHRPKLILADEPTANLDRASVVQVMDLLAELQRQQQTTVILATHDDEVFRKADRVLRLQGGLFA